MNNIRQKILIAGLLPMLTLTACNESGSGDTGANSDNVPAPLASAIESVPVVGTLVADCADTGVGIVDTVIDAIDDSGTLPLPSGIPNLGQLLFSVTPGNLPIIGGLVPDGAGGLVPISPEQILALVPGGLPIPSLESLPVIGQLPTICTTVAGLLPAGALDDPTQLLALLGDPTAALGLIPVLDGSGNPIALVLSTIPGGLAGAGTGSLPGLPGLGSLPDLTSLAPLDPGTVPVIGDLVTTLIGLLETGGLLSGLSGILGLLPVPLPV